MRGRGLCCPSSGSFSRQEVCRVEGWERGRCLCSSGSCSWQEVCQVEDGSGGGTSAVPLVVPAVSSGCVELKDGGGGGVLRSSSGSPSISFSIFPRSIAAISPGW